ncbi:SUMF1/EgtB/PvdO family nonheme iron enzyme [candidate division KSB1 bacterium]|nr:SUMF1/EgtB/PvdO family nonheme iron enzyme [candidate division KSB1 bacterium]
MNPIFRIFVSSTYLDLKDHRKAIEAAINDLDQKFVGMEYLGALDKEPVEACLEMVEQCDLFIGLYAWRYGYVPDNSPFSITELEYRHAIKLEKPRIFYLIDEEFPWNPKYTEKGKPLEDFKHLIDKERVRDTFKDPQDLKYKVSRDISKWILDNRPDLKKDSPKPPGENPEKQYRSAIATKYATLAMLGFKRTFDMDDIYIPLTMHLDPEYCKAGRKPDLLEKFHDRWLKAEDLLNFPEKTAVVLGEPGMGKTTMLHYLARHEGKSEKGLFPIFLKLADFSKTRESLETALLNAVSNSVSGEAMQTGVKQAFQTNKALILLDGMDEVRRDEYNSVTDRIRAFVSGHQNCRVIITSRKAGFQSNELPYQLFEVDRLPLAEIKKYVDKWFGAQTDLGNRLTACIQKNQRINDLAENPFLLSIICLIYEKDKDLPRRRIELYEKCTVTLLTLFDEKQVPKVNVFTRQTKERALENLACHFFGKGVDDFPYTELIDQISLTFKELESAGNGDHLLREICENSGLLQKSDDRYFFVHRTFYEYYVARKARHDAQINILEFAREPRWEEPLRLFAAQIPTDIAGKKEGTQFFEKLWTQDQALALRCYPDMDRVVAPELIKALLNKADVKGRIELVKGLPGKIADTEKVIETLGELFRWETNGEVLYWGVEILEKNGSPKALEIVRQRLDEGAKDRFQKYLVKDMVQIPAGKFKMGGNDVYDGKPIHEVYLDEFSISRFQVTNQLYEIFDPVHGNRRDKYSDRDDQPVIYVNWYEAFIFARWLGCQLPMEAQWEKAARGGKDFDYATKDGTLNQRLANYDEKVGKTTPIGKYPANPFGLYDMSGNVWEWCRDWYDSKYYAECIKRGKVENPEGPATGSRRVLRGGCWRSEAQYCRSANRGSNGPGHRYDYLGFRLVFVP